MDHNSRIALVVIFVDNNHQPKLPLPNYISYPVLLTPAQKGAPTVLAAAALVSLLLPWQNLLDLGTDHSICPRVQLHSNIIQDGRSSFKDFT